MTPRETMRPSLDELTRIRRSLSANMTYEGQTLLAEIDALNKTIDDMCSIAAEAHGSDMGLDAYTPEDCIATIVAGLVADRDEAREELATLRGTK